MLDSITKLLIGDLKDKREYKQMMKRVDALPKDYRFAFRKIQNYMYTVGPIGGSMTMFMDLVELFELSAAENRQLLDVIGSDVSKFCDEFMLASASNSETSREKLNREIMEKFNKEGR